MEHTKSLISQTLTLPQGKPPKEAEMIKVKTTPKALKEDLEVINQTVRPIRLINRRSREMFRIPIAVAAFATWFSFRRCCRSTCPCRFSLLVLLAGSAAPVVCTASAHSIKKRRPLTPLVLLFARLLCFVEN